MKQNLKEFRRKDREKLINSGDLITVSYELEMESDAEIDNKGFFISPISAEKLSEMSPREQVEYLDIESQMKAFLNIEYSLTDLYIKYANDQTSALYSRLFVMITTAYSLGEIGDYSYPIEPFDDLMMESWLLKSFLVSDKGRLYQNKLFYEIAQDEKSMEKLETYLHEQNIEIPNYLSGTNLLLLCLGLTDVVEFGIIATPRDRIDCGAREVFALFFGEDITFNIFNDEISKIDSVIKYLYGYPNPGMDEIASASNSYLNTYVNSVGNFTPSQNIKYFKEFNEGVRSLANMAELFIQIELEKEIENFDISSIESKWGIELNSLRIHLDSLKYQTNNSLTEFLPNFWAKYGSAMDVTTDGSLPLNHNLEIKMKTYISGLDSALEYVDDFYDDFEAQSNFKFTNSTGLHTNVSMELKDKKFNLIKAILFLSEENAAGVPSKAYQGIETRFRSHWSKPLKRMLLQDIKTTLFGKYPALRELILRTYREGDLEDIENELNLIIYKKAISTQIKDYGFNLQYTETRGYIEFRYPGRNVERETLKELTSYYAHIVRASLDPSYKQEEYKKKFIGFLQSSGILDPVAVDKTGILPQLVEVYKQSLSMAEIRKQRDYFLKEDWINSIAKSLRFSGGVPEWLNDLANEVSEIVNGVSSPPVSFLDMCINKEEFYSLINHFQGNKILGRLLKAIVKRETLKDSFLKIFCFFSILKEGYYTDEELNQMGIDKLSVRWYFDRILDIMTNSVVNYINLRKGK